MRALNPTGGTYSSVINVEKLKIVIVKPNEIITGKKEAVDFSDYKATMHYLGLPE